MRKIFYLVFVFCFSFSIAQKYLINWKDGGELVDYGTEKIRYPKFTNDGYEYFGSNVYFKVSFKSDGKPKKIINPQWDKVNIKDLYDLNPLTLESSDVFDVGSLINLETGEQEFRGRLNAFKYENSTIYRLNSFEIVDNLDTQTQRQQSVQNSTVFSTENPLKSGVFYKIKVDKSGIFKITKKFLTDNGINVTNINPKNFRIYGNGGVMLPEYNRDFRFPALQENAIQVVGENDGVWNDDDYALFYAQGPNAFNMYKSGYNGSLRNSRTETRTDRSYNLINIYDDYAYYFINFDIGEGKRIQNEDVNLPNDLYTRYDDYQYVNDEKNNLMKLGRIWVGDIINGTKTLKFSKRSPIQANDQIYYRASVVSFRSQNNNVKFDINGTRTFTQSIPNDNTEFIKLTGFTGSATDLTGNDISINITPNTNSNPNGQFYFDYAEVMYKEDLAYNDGQFNFRFYDASERNPNVFGFSMSNASSVEQIWEVSDITNAKRKVNKTSGHNLFNAGFNANTSNFNNEFVVFKNSAAYTPAFVERTGNQNLSELSNIDYLIITNKEMIPQAQRLATFHKNTDGYLSVVVDVEQIYNEYSSGGRDITAIRDFVSHLKNDNGAMLKYVFILGDSSFDFKNKTSGNDNIVPSYVSEMSGDFINSFISDDYFVQTEPQTSAFIYSILPNLPIGRLPASNLDQAKLLIDKTLAYNNALAGQSSPYGVWRMKLDFVVDDDSDGGGPFHNIMNTSIVNNFEQNLRTEYNVRKLYLDSFPAESSAAGQIYPQVNQAIANDVGNSLYIFYFGHGGINGWTQERVLTLNEITNFNNYSQVYSRFPFVSTITCEFTLWDNPQVSSAGEQFLKLKTGGATTLITSSRAVGVDYGRIFTKFFTNRIFGLLNNDFYRLGDAHLLAKRDRGTDANHLKINFLGDPAMKLSRPKQLIQIDNIDTPTPGQIKALDFVKISGQILGTNGNIDNNFNGKVVVNIYDKRINKSTRNNDNTSNMLPLLNYTEEGSPIVKGAGTAVNGKFVVEFYVPKDINYQLGNGRLLIYADNFDQAKGKAYDVFQNQNIKIGGINEKGLDDNQPPKVNLFMNNTNFANGGITNQNPNLLACVTDDTGINSTGAGIGHDITVILDGKVVNTLILNDYFTAGESNGCVNASLADFQKGNVMYPFRNLAAGPHQIQFKIWDINNNSTTATLDFIVKDEKQENFVMNRLLNWPNPFTDKTYIQFEHNCDDVLDVNVQIFTITGRLVRSFSTNVSSAPFLQGYRTPMKSIEWDGTDDFGAAVGKGTYLFKVNARSQNQEKCKGSATAIEKMVILK